MRSSLVSTLLAIALHAALPCGAQSTDPASPALVTHLLSQLEAREKAGTGLFGMGGTSIGGYMETERQLRRLGSRASAAAPRVAELLTKTEKHASELSWTLWSIAPALGNESPELLWSAAQSGPLPTRLLTLVQLGRDPSRAGLERLETASTWAEREARMIVAIALSQRKGDDQADAAVQRLAHMLQDGDKEVRQAALNGLRLQGARSAAVTAALVQHLRTRENVWMTSQVLEFSANRDLVPLRAELEDILGNTKLTATQKEPAVRLMMRIETELSKPAAAPTPAPVKPAGTRSQGAV